MTLTLTSTSSSSRLADPRPARDDFAGDRPEILDARAAAAPAAGTDRLGLSMRPPLGLLHLRDLLGVNDLPVPPYFPGSSERTVGASSERVRRQRWIDRQRSPHFRAIASPPERVIGSRRNEVRSIITNDRGWFLFPSHERMVAWSTTWSLPPSESRRTSSTLRQMADPVRSAPSQSR